MAATRTFRITDDAAQVRAEGANTLDASSWRELAERGSDASSLLLLEVGQVVAIEASGRDRAQVMLDLAPGPEAEGLLLDFVDAGEFDDVLEWQRRPIDLGVVVDGAPWGWYQTPNDGWRLLPLSFFEGANLVASLSDWMSASMAGMVIEAGCLLSVPTSLSWMWDDNEGTRFVSISYDSFVPATVVKEFFEGVSCESDPECFVCDTGWVTSIIVDETIPEEVVAECLAMRWGVCSDHRDEAPNWTLEAANRSWAWTGHGFVRYRGSN